MVGCQVTTEVFIECNVYRFFQEFRYRCLGVRLVGSFLLFVGLFFLWIGVTAATFKLSEILRTLFLLLINLCRISHILRDVFWKKAGGKPFGPRSFLTSCEDEVNYRFRDV